MTEHIAGLFMQQLSLPQSSDLLWPFSAALLMLFQTIHYTILPLYIQQWPHTHRLKVTCPRHEAYKGGTGMAPLILNLDTRWLLYSRERTPVSNEYEAGWVITVHQDAWEKREITCFYLDSNSGPSSPWPSDYIHGSSYLNL